MTLKNHQVLALVNAGVLSSTNHDVAVKDAYKVFKLRKALSKALTALQDSEKTLLEENGIGDPTAFNEKIQELVKSTEDSAKDELAEMQKQIVAYNSQREELYNDDADLGDIIPISYESWNALQNENKAKEVNGNTVDIFSGGVEEILEGIFWTAPSEE